MEGIWTPTAQTLNGQVRSAYSTLRLLRRPPSGPIPSRRAWSGPPGTPSGPLREDPPGFFENLHFWHFGRFTVNRPNRPSREIQEDDQDPGNRGLGRILVSLGIEVRLGTQPDLDPVGVLTHLTAERLRHLLSISVWTDKGRSSATKDLPSCERLAQDTSIILCQGFFEWSASGSPRVRPARGMELIPSLTLC
jgi:hypothetical protein